MATSIYNITILIVIFFLNIFYCLNNDKRIRHKFFNLVLSSPSVIFIIADPIVKCRTAIKTMFLYINLCLSVKFASLSCSLTSISFLTNISAHTQNKLEYVNCEKYYQSRLLFITYGDIETYYDI